MEEEKQKEMEEEGEGEESRRAAGELKNKTECSGSGQRGGIPMTV